MAFMANLTDQQELFCKEYIIDLNATQAAKRAGYSEKTAQEQGSRLLSNVMVQERITKLKSDREKRLQIDADWVLKQAVKVHERCMQAEPVIIGGEPTGEYKFDSAGANKSLELVGKHVNVQAWKEKLEIEAAENMTPWGSIKAGVDE
ncbi:terminase small subunit [Vibrio phage Seahorse]|uniref:Terminase small subunit n=1 Tax=Vibrio phage Seahorse TaxID=2662136 RepID=A0A6B7SGH9_9CAUD|nr:terminase small subunit [Vibrio phage Seahorse]QGF21013.1 terminase small subunit [Vibrio phage Seahorse]